MSELTVAKAMRAGDRDRPLSTPKVAARETDLGNLREAVSARQRLGLVTGVVAERYRLSPDQAWALLVGLSQQTNVKVREVGRVIHDGFCGQLAEEDRALAKRLNSLGPAGRRPLIDLKAASIQQPR